MKRYCLVLEIKKEHVQEYVEVHKSVHKTHWRTQLDALREAGAHSCEVYMYKNLAIIFYECEDIDESFAKLGAIEDNIKWQENQAPWIAETLSSGGSEGVPTVEKIFDLNQQLAGKLNQF
ncbi:MAG: L-rhamnose mutarotase [Desulfobacterales bacterium]|jgi:L-rhamnose mutarotase